MTIDGAGARSRSAEDGASLASAMWSLVCGTDGGEGDHKSHHAAATPNAARAITPAANSGFREARRPLDAVPISTGAVSAWRASCNIAFPPAAFDGPSESGCDSPVGTTSAAFSTAPGDPFSTTTAVG